MVQLSSVVSSAMQQLSPRSLYGSYFFALAIIFEGSLIFLAFIATKHEVLVAMRIRICGDTDLASVDVQREGIQEIRQRQQEREEKSRKIQHMLQAAHCSHHSHVK
ncbi:uncharacterized protein [Ptychodera flava]|uniref:uncharacterized protein n=1 Tax=Ptychodera flava TaxID=63121 RepID=UPI00396A8C5C